TTRQLQQSESLQMSTLQAMWPKGFAGLDGKPPDDVADLLAEPRQPPTETEFVSDALIPAEASLGAAPLAASAASRKETGLWTAAFYLKFVAHLSSSLDDH